MKEISEIERIVKVLSSKGYMCAQTTAIAIQEISGMESNDVIKALALFSGGVGMDGGACGALSASIAMLGFALDRGKEGQQTPLIYQYSAKIYKNFRKDNKYVNCADMVGVNWWNMDEQAAYFTDPEKVSECKKRIVNAVVYMGKIMEDLKTRKLMREG